MTIDKREILVPEHLSGKRLDFVIHELVNDFSRSKIQQWIQQGHVKVNGLIFQPKKKLYGGELLEIFVQKDQEQLQFEAEDVDLDIIYSDDDITIINKPVGMVVHPAAGNWSGTMLNGILKYYPNNRLLPRAGIVHRLDKDTSGLLVIAKNEIAQNNLIKQLQKKSVYREYRAIVWGQIWQNKTIHKPIGRHPRNRLKMAINEINGKDSITHFEVLERFAFHTYLKCNLETGRTHQIRVHMQHNQTPIVGDSIYGFKKIIPSKEFSDNLKNNVLNFNRQALHAIKLGLIHPTTNEEMFWEINLPNDMKNLLQVIRQETTELNEKYDMEYEFYDDTSVLLDDEAQFDDD